ncbi:hypothetical protein D3C80_2177930 [compost metagenome]
MVNRAHAEDALAACFKRCHLQHDGQHFNYKHTADHHKEQLAFGHNGNGPDGAANPEGTEIPHKYFGRMGIKHQKP